MKHSQEIYKNEILQKIAELDHPGYIKRRMVALFNLNLYAFSWETINTMGKDIIYDEDAFNNYYNLISQYKDIKITKDLITILKNNDYYNLFLTVLEKDCQIFADKLLISIIEKGEKCVKTFLDNKIYEKSSEVWTTFLNAWKPDTIYDISNLANCLEAGNHEKFQELMNKKISKDADRNFKNRLMLLFQPGNEDAFNNFNAIISEINEIDPSKFNSNLWNVIFDDIKFNNYLKFSNKPQPLDDNLLEILSSDSKSSAYLDRIKTLREKFLRNVNVDENSNNILWCKDLVLFHKIVHFVLNYKENHYVSIRWLNENAPGLLNDKRLLEPDILLDLKLLNNINNYYKLHDGNVSINITLLKKFDADTLKELISKYEESTLESVPNEFTIEKNITKNYLKLDRVRKRRNVMSMSEGNYSYFMVNPSRVYKHDQHDMAYFLVSNIRIVRLIAMSDNLTSIVVGTYNDYYLGEAKYLIEFNREILSIINSAAYRKLCDSKLELIANDELTISSMQNEITMKLN